MGRPSSARNYDAIDRHAATPFIAFKKMFHHFSLRREDYLAARRRLQ
jgi:hypothetical protein